MVSLIWRKSSSERLYRQSNDYYSPALGSILVLLKPKLAHLKLSSLAFRLGFPGYMHGGNDNFYFWIMCIKYYG